MNRKPVEGSEKRIGTPVEGSKNDLKTTMIRQI